MSELEELKAAINELRDIEALKALKCRYCHLVDARRWDELLELWTEDAVLRLRLLRHLRGPRRDRQQVLPTAGGVGLLVQRAHGSQSAHRGPRSQDPREYEDESLHRERGDEWIH